MDVAVEEAVEEAVAVVVDDIKIGIEIPSAHLFCMCVRVCSFRILGSLIHLC